MTPVQRPDPGLLRRAIQSAIPDGFFDLAFFPPPFARALDPDVSLVTGIRGSGKSELCRAAKGRYGPWATQAFEPGPSLGSCPSKDTLQKLLQSPRCSPRLVWKTVLLSNLNLPALGLLQSWQEKYSWVDAHPDEVDRKLIAIEHMLRKDGQVAILLFDHFEQMADTLPDRVRLLRGVLELMLELRAFSTLRLKAFVHSDLLSDPKAMDFPGAARVLASRVELQWQTSDLYGLLYTRLGGIDDPAAQAYFQTLAGGFWSSVSSPPPYWLSPSPVMDPDKQRSLFWQLFEGIVSLAALNWFRKMPQDLTDSLGRISPRTFLAAVRFASEDSERRGPGVFPLVMPSLSAGILAAARQWAQGLREDLPWAYQAMERLKGLWVPLPTTEVFAAWRESGFRSPSAEEEGRASTDYDYERTLEQLQQVGAILRMADGRIEVPELYRLGFGLGRHGGFRLR